MVSVLTAGPACQADTKKAEEDHEVWHHNRSAMYCGISCFPCSMKLWYSFSLPTINFLGWLPAGENTQNLILVLHLLVLSLFLLQRSHLSVQWRNIQSPGALSVPSPLRFANSVAGLFWPSKHKEGLEMKKCLIFFASSHCSASQFCFRCVHPW